MGERELTGGPGVPDLAGCYMQTRLERTVTGDLLLLFTRGQREPPLTRHLRLLLVDARIRSMDVQIGGLRDIGGFSLPRMISSDVGEASSPDAGCVLSVQFESGSLSVEFGDAFHVISTERPGLNLGRVEGGAYPTGPRAEEAEPNFAGYHLMDVCLTGASSALTFCNFGPRIPSKPNWARCIFTHASQAVFSNFKPHRIVQDVVAQIGGGRIPRYRFLFPEGAFIEIEAKLVHEVWW